MARIENIVAALEKAIKGIGVSHKDVATLSLIFDIESSQIGIVQTGGLTNTMGPVAALFNSDAGEDIFKAVYAMLSEDTKRMMRRVLTPDHGDKPCIMCRKFEEKADHFGICQHHKAYFDGEEANSKVTKIKEGCPFYEPRRDTEEDS